MRKRFRGNAPISTSMEIEGGDGSGRSVSGEEGEGMGEVAVAKKAGGQMYAGRPAFDVREQMGKGAKGEIVGLGFDEEKTRGL